MSELAHEPDFEPKEKIQSQCWQCSHTVRSALANTVNFIYTKQPWNSHTQLQCLDEDCQAVTILFHDRINDKSIAVAMQYPTSVLEFCDQDDILEVRKSCVDAHDVEAHDLSARQDKNIQHWGEFLQKMVIDVSDFELGHEL